MKRMCVVAALAVMVSGAAIAKDAPAAMPEEQGVTASKAMTEGDLDQVFAGNNGYRGGGSGYGNGHGNNKGQGYWRNNDNGRF